VPDSGASDRLPTGEFSGSTEQTLPILNADIRASCWTKVLFHRNRTPSENAFANCYIFSRVKLKLPPDVIFHHDLSLMVFRPRGVFTDKRIRALVKMLDEAENAAARPFNRFTDLSQLFAVDLDVEAVLAVSLHRQLTYTKRAPVKSAYFVTTEAVARVAKIHTMVTESSYLRVKMFEKMGKAARWLGVPKAMLELDPTASEAPLPRKRGRGSRRRI